MIAESVYPISYADLRENGGGYRLTRDAEAVIAIPSYDTSAKATQGPARPVYVISEDECSWNGGPFKVAQTQGARVVKFVPGGLGAPHPEGARVGQAQPVYVVGGSSDYYLKLLRLFGRSIIGYWPMGEQAPSVYAFDQSRNRFHGIYKNVTLGQPGIGDGLTAPLYDGTNDYNNIYSAGFAGAFNNQEGTFAAWVKMANVGVWTDATTRRVVTIRADVNNLVFINRNTTNNQWAGGYVAGGTNKQNVYSNGANIGINWFNIAITWSKSADQVKTYFNGSPGTTQTGLGIWAGALAATFTVIGASVTTPSNVWSGNIAHALVLNRAATPAEVAAAAVI